METWWRRTPRYSRFTVRSLNIVQHCFAGQTGIPVMPALIIIKSPPGSSLQTGLAIAVSARRSLNGVRRTKRNLPDVPFVYTPYSTYADR
jgi:hypothetical protein